MPVLKGGFEENRLSVLRGGAGTSVEEARAKNISASS